MYRVAYLNGRTYRGTAIARDDVPPLERPDRDLIFAAGAERGIAFETAYWDEPDLAAQGFDLAIIRACWDYTGRVDEFASALQLHENNGVRVLNRPEVVRWNAKKTYLQQLGAAAIPTTWVDRPTAHDVAQAFDALDAAELVLKPQIGGGSIATVRLKRNAWSEADLLAGPQGLAMIQPYLNSIETEGERSLIWFGGTFSHAIRKAPHPGEWLANIPTKTNFLAEPAPAAALEVAEAARAAAPSDLLYVRIDLVLGDDGKWRVIEIEAIEPYLYLAFAREGAARFVDEIARVLGR